VEDAIGESRDRSELLLTHPPRHTTAERGEGVLAEVVPVVALDAFEQQAELERLELELLRREPVARGVRGRIYW
jgi:hypothetical protein